jgi:hypothetical protein
VGCFAAHHLCATGTPQNRRLALPGQVLNSLTKLRQKMMMRRHEAEAKNLPNGLPGKPRLLRMAKDDVATYHRIRGQMGALE